ncbi:hypothetical protein R1flu_008875 [Riccia fluitans]|uniref:Uncharacterized protein n=1 Tax=Riccia fluitans TaxID=41844 RepID=A0ABD1Z0N6_9MARC
MPGCIRAICSSDSKTGPNNGRSPLHAAGNSSHGLSAGADEALGWCCWTDLFFSRGQFTGGRGTSSCGALPVPLTPLDRLVASMVTQTVQTRSSSRGLAIVNLGPGTSTGQDGSLNGGTLL